MTVGDHDKITAASVQIKRPEVVDQVRALAERTGQSSTETVRSAVEAQLAVAKVKSSARLAKRRTAADRALAEFRQLPRIGPILTDADLHDADGLPR